MITNTELLHRIANRYTDLVTAINKGDREEIKALSVSSIATDEDFKEAVRFDADLNFTYEGKRYFCIPGVNIVDSKELDNIIAAKKVPDVFYDVYFVMCLGEVDLNYSYDKPWKLVYWSFGATSDLKRNGEVPKYLLSALNNKEACYE